MKTKTFLLPAAAAALALCAAPIAGAYIGFGLNLAIPLYQPEPATVVYSAPVYRTSYESGSTARSEQVTPSPGPGYVWLAGHWNNVSQRWVWVSGHWELPPSRSAVYVGGHWTPNGGGYAWVEGAWMIPNGGQPQSPPPAPNAEQAPPPPTPPTAQAVPAPAGPAPSAEPQEGYEVNSAPPAPIVEYVPADPYPDWIWVGGFWGWNSGWYWHAGHYAPRPFRGAAWVRGGWVHGGHGWAWHGGHWRR
ncbi:MAG TPA: hypothetical protein VGG34_15060 [Opitutaceae bacterium]|jgi:hypothetical protein